VCLGNINSPKPERELSAVRKSQVVCTLDMTLFLTRDIIVSVKGAQERTNLSCDSLVGAGRRGALEFIFCERLSFVE
jgi:hypothetical protein